MNRLTLASAVAVLGLTSAAPAQIPVSVASGVGGFGPGTRPRTPSLSAPVGPQGMRPGIGRPRGIVGGVYPPYYGGYGGYSGFGYYYPPYDPSPYAAYPYPDPVYVPVYVPPPDPPVRLSGEFPAQLTLAFPAPAEVWLNGEKVEGDPATERVLTSPVLKPGDKFTFRVRARWKVDGQAYEFNREVPVGPGDRSRVAVFSGTAVDGK
jgi:uncharacterized protein (TIGR03000 family)